jgi:hypothetical protein
VEAVIEPVAAIVGAALTAMGALLLFLYQEYRSRGTTRTILAAELEDLLRHIDRNLTRLDEMEDMATAGRVPAAIHVRKLGIHQDSPILDLAIVDLAYGERRRAIIELRRVAINYNTDIAAIAADVAHASPQEMIERIHYVHDRMQYLRHHLVSPKGERTWTDKSANRLLERIVPASARAVATEGHGAKEVAAEATPVDPKNRQAPPPG